MIPDPGVMEIPEFITSVMRNCAVALTESVTTTVSTYVLVVSEPSIVRRPVLGSIVIPESGLTSEKILFPVPPETLRVSVTSR